VQQKGRAVAGRRNKAFIQIRPIQGKSPKTTIFLELVDIFCINAHGSQHYDIV
jgi:hypothetical protein